MAYYNIVKPVPKEVANYFFGIISYFYFPNGTRIIELYGRKLRRNERELE
jgi:hypothetical protein